MKTLEQAAADQANELLAMIAGVTPTQTMLRDLLELAFARGAIYGSDRVMETWHRGLIMQSPAAGSA